MINTNYFYYGQIRTLILHTLRLFQNFCVSEGLDEDGKDILRRVPCVYMSTDKSVVAMLNKATDTILESCPKMVLTISNVKLNTELMSGPAYFPQETSITEKEFDPNIGNYTHKTGNSYNITRLNPLPLGIEFKLYILTSMQEQKFQLFEQIRSMFSPTLELQTSENPLDWSRLTAITLTGLSWSTKGTTNLDSTTLDAMDMTFEVNTNLDMPSLVQKEQMVEQICHSIGEGSTLEDIMSWSLEDVSRTFYSPSNNRVRTFIGKDGKQRIKLEPSEKCQTWAELLSIYGLKYDPINYNININCLTNSNVDKRNDIVGRFILDKNNPTEALWYIDESTLPQTNLKPVDAIINPHDCFLKNINEERYLITEDIGNCQQWGTFYKDAATPFQDDECIKEGSIVEYRNNHWELDIDPSVIEGVYYIRDNSNPLYLYTYNNEYKMWIDVVNKVYPVGFWRISQLNK